MADRCETCYWWGESTDEDELCRTCRLMSPWAYFTPEPEEYRHFQQSHRAIATPWAGANGAGFATSANFGCVEYTTSYEERPNG